MSNLSDNQKTLQERSDIDVCRAEVHICLVSHQLLPNLLPVLDVAIRPREVVLLVTPKMAKEAERLKALLHDAGCRVSLWSVRAYRIEDIRESVLHVITAYSDHRLALNATGGTKVMALGAFGVFRDFDLPVFYVDSENGAMVSLSKPQKSVPLPDLLKVETCLKCYGYKVVAVARPMLQAKNRQLYQALVSDIEQWQRSLASLNYLAGEAKNHLWCTIKNSLLRDTHFVALLELFQQADHLSVTDNRLGFAGEDSRRLVQGGWLEQYVYSLIEELRRKKKVRDAAIGIRVENKAGTSNELDVACTYANRLHIVECKTANLQGGHAKGDDVVYKLDNLRDLMGGTYGRALLVSYRDMRKEDRKRCRDNDVSVVCGRQLQQLEAVLPRWLNGELLG